MATFHFSLEVVLRRRLAIEDDRQRELAASMRLRMILLDQLRQMHQTISQSRHDLAQGLVGSVNLDQISQFARFSAQARQRAQSIVNRLGGVEKQIETARDRLLEASKARKALELLRQHQHEAWQRDQDRREANNLDELALQAFTRQAAVGERS